jgi:hypothetical protein
MHRDDEPRHGYTAKPIARSIEYFEKVIADSFCDDATFMNALLIVRCYADRIVAIHNFNLIESTGTECRIAELAGEVELVHTIVERFDMPRDVVEDVLGDMGQMGDAWT